MRIVIQGRKDGQRKRYLFDLLDNYDKKTNTTSMARTTGYTCSTVVRLLADKRFDRVGICPLEFIGQDQECYSYIIEGLRKKGINFKETVTDLD
jgi:saccharopine dehydrogenase-like NADP-dependent oxidoreductase